MHLFFENISINMFKHWMARFLKILIKLMRIMLLAILFGKRLEKLWKKVDKEYRWNLVDHHVIYLSILMDLKPKNGLIGSQSIQCQC